MYGSTASWRCEIQFGHWGRLGRIIMATLCADRRDDMIMFYKLSQCKSSVSLSLLHLSWMVKRAKIPQHQPAIIIVVGAVGETLKTALKTQQTTGIETKRAQSRWWWSQSCTNGWECRIMWGLLEMNAGRYLKGNIIRISEKEKIRKGSQLACAYGSAATKFIFLSYHPILYHTVIFVHHE